MYGQKEPNVLVRIVGQAPLAATVYSLERLRCGAKSASKKQDITSLITRVRAEGLMSDNFDSIGKHTSEHTSSQIY
jgi:hypothetical protein